MVNILINEKMNNVPYSFQITGHAGFANPGKDVVCAAVSTLAIIISNSMEVNCKDKVIITYDEKKGKIIIKLPTIKNNEASNELIVLSKTLLLGLKQINEQYSNKYISVKEEVTSD